MNIDSEFRLRTQVLDMLIASVSLGKLSARNFQMRFSKAFVETLNKAGNPDKFVGTLRELSVYDSILEGMIPDWKTQWAEFDKKSKERDEVKRTTACVEHVFGIKPNPKTLNVLKSLIK